MKLEDIIDSKFPDIKAKIHQIQALQNFGQAGGSDCIKRINHVR
jgi:hypothetical protein